MEKDLITKDKKAGGGRPLNPRRRIGLFGAAIYMISALAAAQVFEQREFQSPEHERRYQDLVSELRCLVCQNQNLADSNAALATDLRDIVYDMIQDGKGDDEILEFMVDRYGDFVLYRPPLVAKTAALWAGPFLLLTIGLWFLFRQIRRRAAVTTDAAQFSDTEREKLRTMLGDEPDDAESRRGD